MSHRISASSPGGAAERSPQQEAETTWAACWREGVVSKKGRTVTSSSPASVPTHQPSGLHLLSLEKDHRQNKNEVDDEFNYDGVKPPLEALYCADGTRRVRRHFVRGDAKARTSNVGQSRRATLSPFFLRLVLLARGRRVVRGGEKSEDGRKVTSEGRTQSPPGVTHSQTPLRSLTGRKKDLGLSFPKSLLSSNVHLLTTTHTHRPRPPEASAEHLLVHQCLLLAPHHYPLVHSRPAPPARSPPPNHHFPRQTSGKSVFVHHHRQTTFLTTTTTSRGRRPGSSSSFTTTAKPPCSPPPPLLAADAREVRLPLVHHHHQTTFLAPTTTSRGRRPGSSSSFTTTTKPPSSPPPPPLPGKFVSPRSPPPNHHLPRAADAPLVHHDHHFPRHMSSSFARTLLAAIRQAPSPNLLLRILNKILEAPSPTAGPRFPLFQQYLLSLADEILAPPRPSDKPAWIYSYIAPSSQLSLPPPAAPDNLDIKIGRTRKLPRCQQQWALQCPGEPQFWVVAFLVPFAIKFGGLVEAILHRHYKLSGAWRGPTPCDYCPRSHIERFSLFRVGGIVGFCDVVGYYLQALQWPIYYTVL
ncbi:hypothetical protein C8J57DRAFT_1238366 [Mycena rebaudengoi]|nr:hypothetical protein C8J57DRAFT_1238366 [Mycena rebaudengoi]